MPQTPPSVNRKNPNQSVEQKLVHPPHLRAHGRRLPPGAKGPPLQMAARVQRLGPDLLLHVPAAQEAVGGFGLGTPAALAARDGVHGGGEGVGVGY